MTRETYVFSGYINADGDTIVKLLKSFLKPSKIRDRYAVDIQREIKYNDDIMEIYIFDELNEGYLFQGELNGDFNEASAFIETLGSKLKEKKIEHMFEWYQVDENDEQIGEEHEVRYP